MSSTPHLRLPHEPDPDPRGFQISRRSLLIALAVHVVLLAALGVWFFSDAEPARKQGTVSAQMAAERVEEDLLASGADTEEVHEQDGGQRRAPRFAEEVEHDLETDNDIVYEEAFGADAGLSDAPFEGPSNNGSIGVGARAGGAFQGRGGGRDRALRERVAGGGAIRGYGGRRTVKRTGRRTAAPRTTWRRSPLAANAMRLTLGTDASLPLNALHVRATVEGFRARVILECDYFNNQHRSNLEGTFQWRLPDGATPYYLAFGTLARLPSTTGAGTPNPLATDLASLRTRGTAATTTLKEARIVPRTKAARAYTGTVRRRIDPALMEWAGGGVFQSRVFPLQAGRLHRITVGYEVNLEPQGGELVFDLHLPDGAAQATVEMAVRGAQTDGDGATWTTTTYRNPKRPLSVSVPAKAAIAMRSDARRGFPAFAAQLTPVFADETMTAGSPRAVFLLDTSTSNAKSFDTWLRLVESVLAENRTTLREFAVVFFNIEAYTWRAGWTPNSEAGVRAFLAEARRTALEGASDLGAALRRAGRLEGDFDTFLLSDGAGTWGARDPALLAKALGSHRLFAYRGIATGTDGRTLDGLARATGGAVFAVAESAPLTTIARAHRKAALKLKDVRVAGVADLLVYGRPEHLVPGQALWIAGRGRPKAGATIDLVLEVAGKERIVRTPIARTLESDLADSTYGQIAVESLESLGPVVADTARAYALHYRIVGKTCSLLMLDSEADYTRFEVEPEKDSEVVRLTRVRELFERGKREHGDDLLDAKARFLAWADGLTARDGRIRFAPQVRRWMEKLPATAYEPHVETLRCKARTRATRAQADGPMDAAQLERLRTEGFGAADILRGWSRAVELNPGDLRTARAVAFVARELGFPGQARHLLVRALEARPFEVQGYLEVADCLAGAGDASLATLYYEMALASTPQNKIAATHYLGFLKRAGSELNLPFFHARTKELRQVVGFDRADILMTLTWNTDRTDVDLHVRCPTGETCSYKKQRTMHGGWMTDDIRTGYGPEMFVLPSARKGTYEAFVHMYRTDDRRVGSGTSILLSVYENWGTKDERVRHQHVLLGDAKGLRSVAALEWPPVEPDALRR